MFFLFITALPSTKKIITIQHDTNSNYNALKKKRRFESENLVNNLFEAKDRRITNGEENRFDGQLSFLQTIGRQ